MSDHLSVLMPQINPNEIEAVVTAVHVIEGQQVKKGDLIATFETTKASADLQAEADGFISGLAIKPGQKVNTGDLICHITSKAGVKVEGIIIPKSQQKMDRTYADHRLTDPALEFVKTHKIDISAVPKDQLITLEGVQSMVNDLGRGRISAPIDETTLIIYGGGGHGKALIELIHAQGRHSIAGIVDDGLIPAGELLGVKWLGGQGVLESVRKQGVKNAVNAVGGISSIQTRIDVFTRLKAARFVFPSVVHPSAVLENSCNLAEGVQVFPLAYIGSSVKIGFGCIINTGVILSHDCEIGDYVNISPGAILAGSVKVGRATLIGMGVTINLDVHIGASVRIGNSATVKADVPDGTVVHAGSVWPI